MKTFRFVFFITITIALTIVLNRKIGSIPPLGKLLSPFHGFWQNAETEGFDIKEELKLEGLLAPVTVYYDEIRIPHIYAENLSDLHFVQGYLTARDRLWQMDFYSKVVFGRLSEVLGERALDFDKLNRRIGLKSMTKSFYDRNQEDPELKLMLESYSNGVNAYLDKISYADYPIEFKLFNYEPERWTPLKSCIAYALLSNALSRNESDLENTNALQLFGKDQFNVLFPEQLGNLDPVIPVQKKWDFTPLQVERPNVEYPNVRIKETIEKPNPLNGSNNFAVMGSKTKSGNVLLTSETDVDLTLPSIWYAYHMHSPEKNVMGVTIPGTPVILIGFNDSISWGVTNSPRDQVDWYSVKFKDQGQNEYWYNNQWFKTVKVVEEFKVNGSESFYDTIVQVHHGPVVYDKNFRGDSEKANFAMKWIAHQPGTTFAAMNEINKAKGYSDFKEAMKLFTGPPQNFIFGSVSGDIAIWLPGKFPVKWEEQGKYLMDGTDPGFEYQRYIPFDHLMYMKNPEKGFLASANQHPVDSLYPYYVYDHNYEYYRNRRINDRLKVINNIDQKDMMRLQNDNYNYMASESLVMMLGYLDTTKFADREIKYYQMLKGWDYFNSPELEAPTVFQFWWNTLYTELWDEFDTVSVAIDKPNKYTTIHLLKTDSSLRFSDIIDTDYKENTRDLLNLTFKDALDSLDKWASANKNNYKWYEYKNTTISHILRLDPFSVEGIKIGGGSNIVNTATRRHGPSWRMVVELDPKGTKAWGVYPGSQTGNPGNPLYGKLIDNWASGEYYELLFGQSIDDSDKITFIQKIQPK